MVEDGMDLPTYDKEMTELTQFLGGATAEIAAAKDAVHKKGFNLGQYPELQQAILGVEDAIRTPNVRSETGGFSVKKQSVTFALGGLRTELRKYPELFDQPEYKMGPDEPDPNGGK